MNVQGDGYRPTSSNDRGGLNMLDKEMVLNLKPLNEFPVATACSCLRSEASNLSARPRSSSPARRLAQRFMHSTAVDASQVIEKQDDDDDDDSQTLTSLLATLYRFSSRVLNPLQAKSVTRLAHGFRVRENLTWSLSQQIVEFLECDSPPIQDATLIVLAKLASVVENIDFFFAQNPKIVDLVLSLASDAMTIEVQVAAFKVIEEISSHHGNISSWEAQLEDIVYPLLKGVLRNRASTQQQKLAALGVVRHLSHVPGLAGKIKQDVLAQLSAAHNDSKVKALFLEVLQGNLELTKQRIATDVLNSILLPVLTEMLADGPCEPQHQALTLLACLAQDESHRMSLLCSSKTVACCILCAKYSKCRKVIALGCRMLEQLLLTRNKKEAKRFMECNLGCIYHDKNSSRLKSEMSLIGSINRDQLMCITSLIGCFNSYCHWPLNRPRKRSGQMGNVEEFLSLNILGDEINELNHNHTVFVWSCVGSQVMALFRQITKRIQSCNNLMVLSSDTNTKKQQDSRFSSSTNAKTESFDTGQDSPSKSSQSSNPIAALHKEELELLKVSLKFVLLMSLATCYLKRPEHCERTASARSINESVERKAKEDLIEREACAERRVIRRGLVEEGVFHLVGMLANLDSAYIQILSATVLRLCIQPVTEKALSSIVRRKADLATSTTRNLRPHSAKDWLGRQSINQRVFSMSKPGIGQRPVSSVPYCTSVSRGRSEPVFVLDEGNGRRRPATARPSTVRWNWTQGHASRLESGTKYSLFSPLTPRAEKKTLYSKPTGDTVKLGSLRPQSAINRKSSSRLIDCTNQHGTTRPSSAKLASTNDVSKFEEAQFLDAPLDPSTSLSQQCCDRVLIATGEQILKGIFNSDLNIKKSSLLLLHDLVQHSMSELHMELSKMGCIPKLVDFLRINDDDELLEITGLTITRMLVSSDHRICQLFNIHGGSNLLMALLQNATSSELKAAVSSTLSTVNNGLTITRMLVSSDRRICQLFNIHGGSNLLMALLQNATSSELKAAVSSTLSTVNNVMHPSHQNDPNLSSRGHPTDIWEHIMQRWEGEDKVVEVLKQFL
ncbi:synaptophysin [Plakobranchus ocellatus]|uniref:Synaptophysin n=1 Tax=Plakobranchus ocellatus TaxID=259542 RepID=A0AAV3YNI8_9GAST|nr:synaptophysin [Plakobranchus ocellatus]